MLSEVHLFFNYYWLFLILESSLLHFMFLNSLHSPLKVYFVIVLTWQGHPWERGLDSVLIPDLFSGSVFWLYKGEKKIQIIHFAIMCTWVKVYSTLKSGAGLLGLLTMWNKWHHCFQKIFPEFILSWTGLCLKLYHPAAHFFKMSSVKALFK